MDKKTFLTLNDLKIKAEKEFQKIQENKSLWGKLKNTLGSNETMFNIFDKALEYRSFLSLEDDFFKKLDIYEEIFFSSYLAKYLENIKYSKLDKFIDDNEKEYLFMIKSYILKEIEENPNPHFTVLNEAFMVLKEREFEDFPILESKIYKKREWITDFEYIMNEISLFLEDFSAEREEKIFQKHKKLKITDNTRDFDYLTNSIKIEYTEFTENLKKKITSVKLKTPKKLEEIFMINEKYYKGFSFFKKFDFLDISNDFVIYQAEMEDYKRINETFQLIQKEYNDLLSTDNNILKLNKIENLHKQLQNLGFHDLIEYEDIRDISDEIKKIKEKINYIFEEICEKVTENIYKKRDKILSEVSAKAFLIEKDIFIEIDSLKQKYADSAIFLNRLDNFIQNFIERIIDEILAILGNSVTKVSFSEFQQNMLLGFKCIEEFSEKDGKYEVFYKKIEKIKRENFIFSEKYDAFMTKISNFNDNFTDIVILVNYLTDSYEKKEINIFYENKEKMSILKEKLAIFSEKYSEMLEERKFFSKFEIKFEGSNTHFVIIPYEFVSIGKAEGNMIVIKSLNISSEHLLIDFNTHKITNLGKNGTFINKSGDISITETDLEKVEEFNLAKTFTFSIKKSGNVFWGLRLKGITNKNMRFFDEDEDIALDKLKNTYFIVLKKEKSIYFDKENIAVSGQAIAENNVEISFSKDCLFISDESIGLKNVPFMEGINKFFDTYKMYFE